ncbi:hypothetical protein ACFV7R_21700 [Streptomyces sp. NPDC059866]|uniref:hypothetical protein n=1 Tax=Streptomyces sp. NPDC059866 TaxID=3346978 RepID=UPI00365B313B
MDTTQAAPAKPPASRAMLVTLLTLAALNVGLAAGIFARLLGGHTLYKACATGSTAGVAVLLVSLTILKFVLKDGEDNNT